MTQKSFYRSCLIVVLVICFFSCLPTFAQSSLKIKEINVKNNKAISNDTILAKMKTRPGDSFNQDILNDDLKRLYSMGYFTDVSIDVEETPEGVIVIIVVDEKPVIEKIVFEGNDKISTARLQKAIVIKPKELLNYSKLSQDIQSIKKLYQEKGFQKVDIKYDIDKDRETNLAIIFIRINEKERMIVESVDIQGNTAFKTDVLMKRVGTKPAKWFWQKGFFNEERFEIDIENLKAFYQDQGYLDVQISHEITDGKKGMKIILDIKEGSQYLTGSLGIKGQIVFPEDRILELIKMKQDTAFRHSLLRQDMDRIKNFYYQKGYMNVEIDLDRNLQPDTNKIDLVYTITAGREVFVGKVIINGNKKTKDVVVRRELRIYPGDKFDGDKLSRSKERLYNLGFFEDIFFSYEDTYDKNIKDIVVTVKETKTGEFSFGGGYSSIDKFIGFAQVTQRNFDLLNFPSFTGDGQNLSIKATLGTISRDFDISWTEPWIFDRPISFGFDLYQRTHERAADVGYGYEERRRGGDFRLAKEITEYFSADIMYKLEEVKISNITGDATPDLLDERGENWISSLMLGMAYDRRDNRFSPKKGFIVQGIFENAGGPIGMDKDFLKMFFMGAYYYTFYDFLTLEVKGRTGLAQEYSNTKTVPIYERFFAGGSNTIRGYEERKVGPRDPGSNEPTGGNAMLIGNVEATFPIYTNVIKGAVFYDIGNVWKDLDSYFEGGLKSGIGIGVRVKTPIGPIKVDMGYPLSDNGNDDKEVQFYFSVIHGF